jgi:hypothetical protein
MNALPSDHEKPLEPPTTSASFAFRCVLQVLEALQVLKCQASHVVLQIENMIVALAKPTYITLTL